MKKTILALLFPIAVSAGELSLKVGPTLNSPKAFSNKLGALGYSARLSRIFDYQLEGGGFTSLTGDIAFYGTVQLGFTIKGDRWYSSIFTGPSYISATNEYLNTNIQISNDIELGFRDERGVKLALDYKHFSNAGVTSPNLGRDFLLLKVAVPFNP